MNLLRLQYFVQIAQYENFSKAAEHMHVSQPTLSRNVMKLEEDLGAVLFLRNKNALELTDAGRQLLNSATKILAKCKAIPEIVQQSAFSGVGTLSIGYQEYLNTDIMHTAIHALAQRQPDIRFSLTRHIPPPLLCDLRNDVLDVVFTLFLCMKTMQDIKYRKLRRNRLQVAVSCDHRLAVQKEVHISELANEHFIMMERRICPVLADYSP